jgi:hypothetical protein
MTTAEKVMVKILDLPGDSSSCPCLMPPGGPEHIAYIRQKARFLESALEEAYPGRTRVDSFNLLEHLEERESAAGQLLVTGQSCPPLVLINSEVRFAGVILRPQIAREVGRLLAEEKDRV